MSQRQPEEFGKGQKETPPVLPPPSRWHPSWLSNACPTQGRTLSQTDWPDNQGTNPITIKPDTASHTAEQFSWVPTPSCSPAGHPFPIKSLAFSARVSPQTIYVRILRQEPTLRPWKGSPFLQHLNAKPMS